MQRIRFLRASICLLGFVLQASASLAQVNFAPYVNYTMSGTGPWHVVTSTIGDFNEDGIPDIAAGFRSNNATTPSQVGVRLGTGGGNFGPPSVYAPGVDCWLHNIAEIQAADFNNDSHLDLVLTEGGSAGSCFGNKVTIQLGNGLGGFASPGILFTTGGSDGHIAVGDFNEDNRLDLAIAVRDVMSMYIHLGNGNGTMSFAGQISGWYSDPPFITRDLNADGHLDLAIVRAGTVQVALGTGTGAFASPVAFVVPSPFSPGAGDFDEDGTVDLVVASQGSGTSFLRGTGGGAFAAAQVSAAATSGTSALVVADFDLDGHLDVATHAAATALVYVARGTGTGAFGASQTFAVGGPQLAGYFGDLRGADLNADGKVDLVAGAVEIGGVSVLINIPATVPVALSDLAVEALGDVVQLSWLMRSDEPSLCHVLRRTGSGPEWTQVSEDLIPDVGLSSMRWIDRDVAADSRYAYTVEFVEHGVWSRSPVLEISTAAVALRLNAPSPNPARGITTFGYSIARAGHAEILVVDARGRRVKSLLSSALTAGSRSIAWDGRDDAGRPVSAGTYFVQLQSAGRLARQRVVRID